jgi:hypothetical protein
VSDEFYSFKFKTPGCRVPRNGGVLESERIPAATTIESYVAVDPTTAMWRGVPTDGRVGDRERAFRDCDRRKWATQTPLSR